MPISFQAAVYGIGVCAEFGGSVFKPLVGGRLFHGHIVAVLFVIFFFLDTERELFFFLFL